MSASVQQPPRQQKKPLYLALIPGGAVLLFLTIASLCVILKGSGELKFGNTCVRLASANSPAVPTLGGPSSIAATDALLSEGIRCHDLNLFNSLNHLIFIDVEVLSRCQFAISADRTVEKESVQFTLLDVHGCPLGSGVLTLPPLHAGQSATLAIYHERLAVAHQILIHD